MTSPRRTPTRSSPLPRFYRGADIPLRGIRRFARQVAERFQPDKIILFGSYAYGTPHQNSDVDLLVIMPARNQLDQAFKIHGEIVSRGKVLYEKNDTRVGAQGQRGLPAGPQAALSERLPGGGCPA